MKRNDYYGEINLKFDSREKKTQKQIVKGDEETLSALIGALIHNLLESGFDRRLLEHAIEKALNETENKKSKIQVKEIKITKDNEEDFKELLKKIGIEV